MKKNIRTLLTVNIFNALLGGSLAGLTISAGIPFLIPLSIAFLWSVSNSPFGSFIWGWIAILISHRWLLALHPLSWIGISEFLSLPLTVLIWLLCGFLGGSLVGAWSILSLYFEKQILKNSISKNKFKWALFLSTVWGLLEVILAHGPLFWIGLGNSLLPSDIWLAGLARVFGSGGLAIVQMLSGWWIWRIYICIRNSQRSFKLFFIGLFTLSICHFIGFILLVNAPVISNQKVALWQTNIPIRDKFNKRQLDLLPDKIDNALSQAIDLGADLLVAPEGTLPVSSTTISPVPIKFLTGGFRFVNRSQRSSILFFDIGDETYSYALDKNRLVPLGEWLPSFDWFRVKGLSAVGGLSPGSSSRLFQWSKIPFVGTICYEISDGISIREAVSNGGQWILSIANLDPYPELLQRQFLSIAQLRSIESSRDLISVANTGPTSIVRSSGKVDVVMPPLKELVSLVDLNIYQNRTLYSILGEIPLIFILLISLFFCKYL